MNANIIASTSRLRLRKRFVTLLIFAVPIWTYTTSGPGEPGHKAIVHIPAEGGETAINHAVSELDGIVIADRGSFAVMEIPAEHLDEAGQMEGVTIRRDFDQVQLARKILNTRAARGSGEAISGLSMERGMKILQLSAPPVDADLDDLAATGVEVVSYIPQNAYLVWAGSSAAAESLRGLVETHPMFHFATDWRPEFARSRVLDRFTASEEVLAVNISMFRPTEWTTEEETDAVLDVAMFAENASADISFGGNARTIRLAMRVSGNDLAAISNNPTILWIEPVYAVSPGSERQAQILAGNLAAAGAEPSGPNYLQWLDFWDFPSTASSYPIVALVDDGLDNGTTTPARSVFSGTGRITFSLLHPGNTEDPAPAPVGRDAHGDVNATIMIGYDTSSGEDEHEDAEGFNFGLGVSPYGRIGNLKVFGVTGVLMETVLHNEQAIEACYSAGARISNNSWGAGVEDGPGFPAGDGWSFWGGAGGVYTELSSVYDQRTRDALPGTGGNQEMMFVCIAHNWGPNPRTVMPPGTAKNVLTVGGSENYDIYAQTILPDPGHTGGPDEVVDGICETPRRYGDDARDMAAFSGAGPCDVALSEDGNYGVWINEFHYNDVENPATESFVEIAGQAGFSLEGWSVWAFRGELPYDTYADIELSGSLPNQEACMGTLHFPLPGLSEGVGTSDIIVLALMNPRGQPVHFVCSAATAIGGVEVVSQSS